MGARITINYHIFDLFVLLLFVINNSREVKLLILLYDHCRRFEGKKYVRTISGGSKYTYSIIR